MRRIVMFYVRSFRTYPNDNTYETGSKSFPTLHLAESAAIERFSNGSAVVAVVVAKPNGTGDYGFQKRRDIVRFEREDGSIRKRALV
jgi:hypothetical protein